MKYNKEYIRQLTSPDFLYFWGHQPSKDGTIGKSCLSQWWISQFEKDGVLYHTAEHYMMAAKARIFQDEEVLAEIIKSKNPREVKALGRRIKGFDDKIWNDAKYRAVVEGNYLKFSQDDALSKYLIDTSEQVIVEASPVDSIWGVGMAEDHPDISNVDLWRGENLLGFALMEARDLLNSKK